LDKSQAGDFIPPPGKKKGDLQREGFPFLEIFSLPGKGKGAPHPVEKGLNPSWKFEFAQVPQVYPPWKDS